MGASKSTPLSKRKQKEQWRDDEYYMQLAVQRVENAVLLSYMIGSRQDSVLLTLGCSEGRRRFNDYIIFEKKSADVDFWYDCRCMDTPNLSDFWERAERIYDVYLAPSSPRGISLSQEMRDCVADMLQRSLQKAKASSDPNEVTVAGITLRQNVLGALAEAEEETLGIVSSLHWSQFIQSRSYIFWRCHERAHASAVTAADVGRRRSTVPSGALVDCGTGESGFTITDVSSLSGNGASESCGSNPASRTARGENSSTGNVPTSSDVIRSLNPTYKSLQSRISFCQRALSAVATMELVPLLCSKLLLVLLAAVEGVPLCFSLHSAARDATGLPSLPFVFANKFYERIFGVDRMDLLGKLLSCLFRTQHPMLIPARSQPPVDCDVAEWSVGSSSTSGLSSKQGGSLLMTNFHQVLKDLSSGKSCVFSRQMARNFIPQGAQAARAHYNAENSRSVDLREDNALIVGLKPVYCDDDKSIKYFIALQHQVTSEDDWVHAFKYIGDVLALIPEAFDLWESEEGYEATCAKFQEFVPVIVRKAEDSS